MHHSTNLLAADDESLYTRVFWMAFIANVLLVSANALTFRFAEFVSFLGGTEEITGRIVGFGLFGSLFLRAFLGQALDYFGIRRVWLSSCVVFLIGTMLTITAPDVGLQIYIARVIFVIGIASMFASSVSHIQSITPEGRRTEVIAKFGSSGFIGIICGSQAGDWLFNMIPESRYLYQVLFGSTFMIGVIYLCMATLITHKDVHSKPSVAPPIHTLMLRYWPPIILIVTMMMGLGFGVTMTFLTRYSTELGLGGIRTFFTAYAITAFSTRLISSRWSRTFGRHKLIVIGLAAHALGQLLMTFVTIDALFIAPAFCMGFGHALLYPCIVSLGAGAFPAQYRGTGTAVTLAAVDIGTIVTAPIMGWIIDHHGFHPMFYISSIVLLCSSLLYFLLSMRMVDSDILLGRNSEIVVEETDSENVSEKESLDTHVTSVP